MRRQLMVVDDAGAEHVADVEIETSPADADVHRGCAGADELEIEVDARAERRRAHSARFSC